MDFNYYSFFLRGEERIYYTSVVNDTDEEILDWAVRFNFIKESDVAECSNVRPMTHEEVERRNRELYKIWWEKRQKNVLTHFKFSVPPTIGEVQLD